jgi:hypothetical protein
VVVVETPAPEDLEFYYGIATRFSPISKSTFSDITSLEKFMTPDDQSLIKQIHSIKVIIIENDIQTDERLYQEGNKLSAAQISLIENLEYSANFLIGLDCTFKNGNTGELDNGYYSPHFTITPHVQAQYKKGEAALLNYLKVNSQSEVAAIDLKKVTPAKIYFTVTKNGEITNIKQDRTTSYPLIDNKMMALISDMPGKWIPAQNKAGIKVDQELVFTFGLGGC